MDVKGIAARPNPEFLHVDNSLNAEIYKFKPL